MAILTIIILLFILGIAYWQTRSVLHPAVITSALWSIMIILYHVVDFGLYALTDKIYYAILCWSVPLCIVSILPQYINTKVPVFVTREGNEKIVNTLRPIVIISAIIALLALIYRGLLYNPSNVFNGIRQASVEALAGEESLVTFPFIIRFALTLSQFFLLPFTLYLIFIKKEKSKYVYILLSLLVVYVLFRSSKSIIAQFSLAFFCIAWHKKIINKRNVLLFVLIFIGLMFLLQLLRRTDESGDFDIIRFISIYLMASFPAMDGMMQFPAHSMIESFNGEYTFRAFLKIIQLFDPSLLGNSDEFNLKNWSSVPLPTNVYTILYPFYEDFGYAGLGIFGAIYGLIGGILHKHMQADYTVSTLMYSSIFFVFVFQFFNDFGMMYFWTHISFLLCILLITFPQKKQNL